MADNDVHTDIIFHTQHVLLQDIEEAILSTRYEVIDISPHALLQGYYVVTQQASSPIPLPKDSDWYAMASHLEPNQRDENFKVLGRFRRGAFSLQGANAEVLIQKVRAQKGFLCFEEKSILENNIKHTLVTKECLVVVRAHTCCAQQCWQFALPKTGLIEDSHTQLRTVLDTGEAAYLTDQIPLPVLDTQDT